MRKICCVSPSSCSSVFSAARAPCLALRKTHTVIEQILSGAPYYTRVRISYFCKKKVVREGEEEIGGKGARSLCTVQLIVTT